MNFVAQLVAEQGKGRSLRELAAETEISHEDLLDYVHGRYSQFPDPMVIYRLAKVLGVPDGVLLNAFGFGLGLRVDPPAVPGRAAGLMPEIDELPDELWRPIEEQIRVTVGLYYRLAALEHGEELPPPWYLDQVTPVPPPGTTGEEDDELARRRATRGE